MNNINIEATEYTPKIILDKDKNLIDIRGNSFPENTFDFYMPVTQWIQEYFKNKNSLTTINIDIDYFNSSSSQQFFDIFDLFAEAVEGNLLEINWIYDKNNESSQEAGDDFIEEFDNLKITLIEK